MISRTTKVLAASPNVNHTDDDDTKALLNMLLESQSSSSSSSSFPLMAFFISGGVVGTVLMLTLPFIVMPLMSGQSLPYMATPKHKLQQAFKFIQQQQRQTRNQSDTATTVTSNRAWKGSPVRRQFLDLGSGDGEAVYQAVTLRHAAATQQQMAHNDDDDNESRYYYYTKCIGIELNTTLYMWSCWRRILFWTRPEQLRSQFHCRDMFRSDNNNNSNDDDPQQPQHIIRQSDTILIFGIPSLMVPLSQLLAQHCQSGTYILCYRFPLPTHEPQRSRLLPARLVYNQDEMRIYECTDTTGSDDSIQVTDRVEANKEKQLINGIPTSKSVVT